MDLREGGAVWMGAYQHYNSADQSQSQGKNDNIGRRGGVRKGDREGIKWWEGGVKCEERPPRQGWLNGERNVVVCGYEHEFSTN